MAVVAGLRGLRIFPVAKVVRDQGIQEPVDVEEVWSALGIEERTQAQKPLFYVVIAPLLIDYLTETVAYERLCEGLEEIREELVAAGEAVLDINFWERINKTSKDMLSLQTDEAEIRQDLASAPNVDDDPTAEILSIALAVKCCFVLCLH